MKSGNVPDSSLSRNSLIEQLFVLDSRTFLEISKAKFRTEYWNRFGNHFKFTTIESIENYLQVFPGIIFVRFWRSLKYPRNHSEKIYCPIPEILRQY